MSIRIVVHGGGKYVAYQEDIHGVWSVSKDGLLIGTIEWVTEQKMHMFYSITSTIGFGSQTMRAIANVMAKVNKRVKDELF